MWIDDIYNTSERLVSSISTDYVRSVYDDIKWESRMVCLKGARGVGKTTLLLQRMKQCHGKSGEAVYATLDDLCFSDHRLAELVEYHYLHGGRYMFLDEVHRYPSNNWAQELKNIYDKYPGMHIAFSGSSVLVIDSKKADLSRRCMFYDIPGLSFREYLEMSGEGSFKAYTLEEILENHLDMERQIVPQTNIILEFERYLQKGYYPFFNDDTIDYGMALRQMVSTVTDTDLPAAFDVEYATIVKLKRLFAIISHTVPFVVNVSATAETLGATRSTVEKMLYLLGQARLVNLLYSGKATLRQMSKPEKVYLENPNLMYALSPSDVNIGTVRESFFANQLSWGHSLSYSGDGDFLIDDKYTVEVGGRRKSFNQIKDIPNSFLAIDTAEYGHINKIPLWLFGFMY